MLPTSTSGFGFGGTGDFSYSSPTGLATGAGWEQVSLADIINNPGAALPQIQSNFQANLVPFIVGSFFTSLSFRVGKKLISRPLGRINRGLFGKRGIIGNVGFKL